MLAIRELVISVIPSRCWTGISAAGLLIVHVGKYPLRDGLDRHNCMFVRTRFQRPFTLREKKDER